MWPKYKDNEIEDMKSDLKSGKARFKILSFYPEFMAKSGNKMIQVKLAVQDSTGNKGFVNEFFNVYTTTSTKAQGFAHYAFKQFLRSVGRIDIYDSQSNYGSLVNVYGDCEIEIVEGYPRVKKFIVPDGNVQQPAVQQNTVQQQSPQQQQVPVPDLGTDLKDDDIPF